MVVVGSVRVTLEVERVDCWGWVVSEAFPVSMQVGSLS